MSNDPACWSWPVPIVETREQFLARLEAYNASVGPNLRRNPKVADFMDFGVPSFSDFHTGPGGRLWCAICETAGRLVLDHCHGTGQVRGWLCMSCNVLEGRSGHPVFEAYRRRHPASILDVHDMYHDGIGWIYGWSAVEHRTEISAGGPRPPTPWE